MDNIETLMNVMFRYCALGLLGALLWAGNAQAMPRVDRDGLVEEISSLIAQHYLLHDKGEAIARQIKAHRLSFSQNDPLQFARDVSDDLFVVSSDKHLKLIHDPILNHQLSGPPSAQAQVLSPDMRFIAQNYGVPEARVLGGNLGYIRLTSFLGGHEAMRRADAAFALVASTDALILDLRGNGGGDAEFVRYVQGYFFERPTLAMRFQDPGARALADSYSRQPQGIPKPERPLVVLIDRRTASAAEDFAYSAQAFELGTVVGEISAGAAYTVSQFPLEGGFVLSVSTGQPLHPKTNGNWEAVGITPDVSADPESSLLVGQMTALEALLDDERFSARHSLYRWAHLPLAAELNPPKLPLSDYLALMGSYGFGRVDFSNDVLTFTPQGGTQQTLIPLSRDDFAVEGLSSYRYRFDFSGARPVLARVFPDGRSERFELLHK